MTASWRLRSTRTVTGRACPAVHVPQVPRRVRPTATQMTFGPIGAANPVAS
jgi:hypothetical protein